MAALIPSEWRKIHPSTLSAAAVGAAIALVASGPVIITAIILKCCDGEEGPMRNDWIKLGAALAGCVLLGALIGGGISSHLRKRRRKHGRRVAE
jgi:hypothetical protein